MYRKLLATPFVTEPTRRVLEQRSVETYSGAPLFFDAPAYVVLQSVCARLIPQPEREPPIPIAGAIDRRLSTGEGKGWRYDCLLDDRHTFTLSLAAIDRLAAERFQCSFCSLAEAQQDDVLTAFAQNEPLFFEELLAMAVEFYYAHPLAQKEIAYVGFADAAGWNNIGLDESEPWESRDR